MARNDLTQGSIFKNLIRFSLPFLLVSFLQTFYGLADLYITGQFNGASTITAVSNGSQITHMLTIIVVGLSMGSTVLISRGVGSKNDSLISKAIGNTVILFAIFALALTVVMLLFTDGIISIMSVPPESITETRQYLMICFAGIPFIVAYNVISSIFRGLGDSRTPMYFVAVAGVINVGLDYILIGPFDMGATGAAIATVTAQAISVATALVYMKFAHMGITLHKSDFRISKATFTQLLRVGIPISLQDGFIQVAFIVITIIANTRGVEIAAAVGIVEKLIGFMFLVPSAMLSAVSAISAQSAGAGEHHRARKTLFYAIWSTIIYGVICCIICQIWPQELLHMFAKEEPVVIIMGAQYLRAYALDCFIAGTHFCFSGYFCAYQKAMISFCHNVASVLLIRIPGSYLAAVYFTESLYPMGLASPMGSLLSVIICIIAYKWCRRKGAFQ